MAARSCCSIWRDGIAVIADIARHRRHRKGHKAHEGHKGLIIHTFVFLCVLCGLKRVSDDAR